MTSQEKFLVELNIFRNEIILVSRSLYMELAIHAIASKNKSVLTAMNRTPTFWNTVLSGFQNSTFITIGRIFDNDSKHNIHRLFKIAQDNKSIFSKKSFGERWVNSEDKKSSGLTSYLPEYMKKFYEPTDDDFRKLKKFIAVQQKTYEDIYRPIRHHFGHKKYSTNEEVKVLFDKVNVSELEKFCVTLDGIHESLWQLYHNGCGPMLPLKKNRYSTKNILKSKPELYRSTSQNAQYIDEVKSVLDILKNGNKI
jgi:hypothetical protein